MHRLTDINMSKKITNRTLNLIKKGVFVQIPTIFFDYAENSLYERTHSEYGLSLKKPNLKQPYNWLEDTANSDFRSHYYKQVVVGPFIRLIWSLFDYIKVTYTLIFSNKTGATREDLLFSWRYWDIDGYRVLNRHLISESIYNEHDSSIYKDYNFFRYFAILDDREEGYWRVIKIQEHPFYDENKNKDLPINIVNYKKNSNEGSILTYFLEDRIYLHKLFGMLYNPFSSKKVKGNMPILQPYDQFTPVLFRFLLYRFKINYFSKYYRHPFHILEPDMSPIIVGLATGEILYCAVKLMNYGYGYGIIFGLLTLILGLFIWWSRVIAEASYLQEHNHKIRKGLKLGMVLFIVSEVMFFFGFFWSYFHLSVNPSIWQGAKWPPMGTPTVSPTHIPLLNTVILLTSGTFVTLSERFLRCHRMESGDFFSSNKWWNNRFQVIGSVYLLIGVLLGFLFTFLQGLEYYKFKLKFSDGAYGSIFYISTGFHGLHVIIGAIFLTVCLFRCKKGHFAIHITGLVMAAWYWHFVDVVWLFLYVVVYCWGQWEIPLVENNNFIK